MAGWLPGVDADFVWVVPGLAVGGQPTRQQMPRLRSHGIDALLSALGILIAWLYLRGKAAADMLRGTVFEEPLADGSMAGAAD